MGGGFEALQTPGSSHPDFWLRAAMRIQFTSFAGDCVLICNSLDKLMCSCRVFFGLWTLAVV